MDEPEVTSPSGHALFEPEWVYDPDDTPIYDQLVDELTQLILGRGNEEQESEVI